jgi:hypothetical protein
VIGGATFGFKNFGHSGIIASIGGQAVDRLSGQAQQLTALQSLCSGSDGCGELTVENHRR